MFELSKEEEIKIKSILKEKLKLTIKNKRNLFNFAFLDEFEENMCSEIENVNSQLYSPYNNIFEAIDAFNSNIEEIIDNKLKEEVQE